MAFSDYIAKNLDGQDEFQRERYAELIKRLRVLREDPCQVEPASNAEMIIPAAVVLFLVIGTIIAIT